MLQQNVSFVMKVMIRSSTNKESKFGYCILLEGNFISWMSKKHIVVAKSSAK